MHGGRRALEVHGPGRNQFPVRCRHQAQSPARIGLGHRCLRGEDLPRIPAVASAVAGTIAGAEGGGEQPGPRGELRRVQGRLPGQAEQGGPVEQAARLLGKAQDVRVPRTCRMARQGGGPGIAAERGDVPVNPGQRLQDVAGGKVARTRLR